MSGSGRPGPGEFAEYARADIDLVPGDDAVQVLETLARDTLALLQPLAEAEVRGLRYAPGKWTLKEVVGHLADDERVYAYRALCLARTEPLPLPGFDEQRYVAAADFESRPWGEVLDDYRTVRQATVTLFRPLSPEMWLRRGTANGHSVTVRGLAFHIAGHELHHLRLIREKYLAPAGRHSTGGS